jgi:hypothetical protein
VVFAYLHRAKSLVPLAAFAFAHGCLHIFHHHITDREKSAEVSYHPGFSFPSAARRWWKALLPIEPILEPFGPAPFTKPAGAAHRSPGLDSLFDMSRSFHHQIQHRFLSADDTDALELTARIDACHKGLIVRFLSGTELDIEQTQLIAPGTGLAALT